MIAVCDRVINVSIRVIIFVYSNLIGMFVCPSIDTIIGSIQATFGEPDNIAILEASVSDRLERAIPIQSLFCNLDQIFVRNFCHGLLEVLKIKTSEESGG